MEYILLFLFIFLIYKLFTASRKTYKEEYKVEKMSAFDAYLIQHHKESQARVDAIPTVKFEPSESKVESKYEPTPWIVSLYADMIISGEYPDEAGLKKEACESMGITEKELDELLENYKLDNKKKK